MKEKEREKNLIKLELMTKLISFSLIYSVRFFRKTVTLIIFVILRICENHPNILSFIIQFIILIKLLFRFDKSPYTFIFGLFASIACNYILIKITLICIPDFIIKWFAILLKQIYYIIHIILSYLICTIISVIVVSFLILKV